MELLRDAPLDEAAWFLGVETGTACRIRQGKNFSPRTGYKIRMANQTIKPRHLFKPPWKDSIKWCDVAEKEGMLGDRILSPEERNRAYARIYYSTYGHKVRSRRRKLYKSPSKTSSRQLQLRRRIEQVKQTAN